MAKAKGGISVPFATQSETTHHLHCTWHITLNLAQAQVSSGTGLPGLSRIKGR